MQTTPPYSSATVISFIPTAPVRPKQAHTSSSYVTIGFVERCGLALSVLKHQTRLLAV